MKFIPHHRSPRDNVKKVRDLIEEERFLFDMHHFYSPACGTVACIGGHAAYIYLEENPDSEIAGPDCIEDNVLADWLGISEKDYRYLCFSDVVDYKLITREVALDYIITTGRVAPYSQLIE